MPEVQMRQAHTIQVFCKGRLLFTTEVEAESLEQARAIGMEPLSFARGAYRVEARLAD
jgi:hypothetical protein